MSRRVQLWTLVFLFGSFLLASGMFSVVSANRYSSTNYIIDASVGNSFGGSNSSTNYKLTGSGGESVIGNGASGSYKLGTGYVAQLDRSLQLTVQPSNLAAYYAFDESTGTQSYDSSINSLDGSITNGPTRGAGKLGNALTFDGVDDTVTVPDNAALDITGDMTISCWVKPSGLGPFVSGAASVVSKRTDTAHTPFHLLMKDSGQMRFNYYQVSTGSYVGVNALSAQNIDTSRYYHVTATRTSTQIKIYIDGALSNSAVVDGVAEGNSQDMLIGGGTTQYSPFPGSIDEVKLYDRAMSDAEVKAEYDAQNAGNNAGASLNTITPGASQTAGLDAVVSTDAPGYSLAVNQNQNLTNGLNTIPGISGSIASPLTWSEGSTKGLGFTLYGTNATALPGKWSSGNAYAAFPGSGTAFYTRNGFNGGSKDVLNLRIRADVAVSQATGDYSNVVTWTGTMTP